MKNKVTAIQFFDYSKSGDNAENGVQEYSANIIIDDSYIIQLSGNQNESNDPYLPTSNEQYFNNAELQDKLCNDDDFDNVENLQKLLDENGIENNFKYLQENGENV